MSDRLARAFQRAARGATRPSDDRAVAAVFEEQHGRADRLSIEQNASERFGAALAVAIQKGTPAVDALQGFLRLLKAGSLCEAGGALVFEPDQAAHPMTRAIAERALRIALSGAGAAQLSVRSA